MDENKSRIQGIVMTSVFAALTFAATFLIKIPLPAVNGYVHPGDAIVVLSGLMLGGKKGFLAAGIGSALADLLGGYVIYAPVTFFIKGFAALLAAVLFKALMKKLSKHSVAAALIAGSADIILVPGGYFIFSSILYGTAAALISIVPDLFQALFGLFVATILYPILRRINVRGK
ncbi:MAG: ECF transporter S component [Lachnospiraceae bacterium]|nr:ECF transporter S component [Lachnospiraceae bacterium]